MKQHHADLDLLSDPATTADDGALRRVGRRGGQDITLRKLQVFWAVAHTRSITRAAKLLGVTQPSLSPQLAGLETCLGVRLFERRSNTMELTEAGQALLPRAEVVLRSMQEFENGFLTDGVHGRQTLRIGGVGSVLRRLVPPAIAAMKAAGETDMLDFDLHEGSPDDVLELLHARRVHVGLVAENTVAEAGSGFVHVPLMSDPMVLAVSRAVDLSRVADGAGLPPGLRNPLGRTVQFSFGNQHARSVEAWFARVLPESRLHARVRSYDLVIDFVCAGLGIGVVPSLCLAGSDPRLPALRLFATDLADRRIVAMIPTQYRRNAAYAHLLQKMQVAGQTIVLPPVAAMPPFIAAGAALAP